MRHLRARAGARLHAGLDIAHSKTWNVEVIHSVVVEHPQSACPIAEGALLRLVSGARCFARYRAHFKLGARIPARAVRQSASVEGR